VTQKDPDPDVHIHFKDDKIELSSLLTEYSGKLKTVDHKELLETIELKDNIILIAGLLQK